ncbi:ATP-binding cassette domain-containing protein [Parapedobacter sp. ISTM3]|uniref:ABC transporter, permease/ATP-binding protein n=1 Tax=Parapedobacter luteus TaxID=623280 RepID=A0A1T5DP12_9SPHI|nr:MULTISPECIES: ABC transporter transmembrane domain-containing protein [Parapedobacter]MBK1440910.1 ATP-binding cassette domain-containing protein [Parapedobacter sp. ISTM3]SKB73345.1 ABC transporter, permease/ATP-binding protein [Parapedobacter luteus]
MARQRLNSGDTPSEDLPKPKLTKTTLRKAAKLLAYLKPYRLKFIVGMVFLFLSSLTALTFPALLGAMIDAAQGERSYAWIPADIRTIGAVAFAILFVQSVVSFFRIRLFVEVAEKSLADIRRDSYYKLITLPLDFFANRRVGELNSRLSADLAQIQDTMTTTLAEIIRQIILLSGGVCLLFVVSGKLTLLNLSILPILVVIAVVFGRFIRKLSRKAQDKLAESNTVVQETLQGISNVKAFVNEAYEAARYSKALHAVVKLAVKGATYRGIFASFIIFCLFGAVVAVIWYGSALVATGNISVGDLTTYILYSIFVAGSMGSFPELYANVQKAIGASERVIEILDEQQEDIGLLQEEKTIKNPIAGSVAFQNVTFAYPSRREITVLKNVSFHAQAGEKIAIVGPSGTGKSTIAALILQFYKPDSGHILFDDREASSYPLTDIRHQVAIVPQDVLLFGGTIRENIAYGRLDADADEIITAAKRANAHDFIMDFPEGYDTLVGERGVKLSGGQRQRIAIARALLKDPAILILDEATSSLDSESERQVQQALEELMKNRTSIIIAHRLSTIREADQIVVVECGQVVASGTHQELMEMGEGLYHHLYKLQLADK